MNAIRLPDAATLVRLLSEDPKTPGLTATEIAARLGLAARARPALRRLLRECVAAGTLVAMRDRRFASRKLYGDVVGRFTRHPAGFGFVAPDDPLQVDLFIPPFAQAGALHGDMVAARVTEVQPDGRRAGEIVRVLTEGERFLLGAFRKSVAGGVVDPLERGFGFSVIVGKEQTGGAASGEIVRVRLEGSPGAVGVARGHVVERLGRPEDPGVDVEILIRKYDLSPEFPADVLREVAALPGQPSGWPLAEREDFTARTVVTIDGETAKDFDDAICVEPLPGGGYRLHVLIADVSFFVSEGSRLDQEALRRGTSVYFPGRAVPMLPERLSNDLCSLRPDEIRLTQGVTIDYDAGGTSQATRFHDGYIRSAARLTYGEVAQIVEERLPEARARRPALLAMLDLAAELAQRLAQQRKQRGAVDFDLPEPEIMLDLTGATTDIVARPRNAAHRLIEEFMLAANEAVAIELKKRKEPTLYRAHEKPDIARLAKHADLLAGLGYDIPEPFDQITPRDLARLVEAAKGRPEEPFVSRLVLRSMALARYDAECLGHFGLALRRYLHFTSPIRRYPDLVVHRSLRRLRHGEPGDALARDERAARLPDLARDCSRLEREAEQAERESIAWKKAAYMAERVGDEFGGTIVEVARHGLMVALDEPYVEGLLPIGKLGREYFRHDPRRHTLRGIESGVVFRVGQKIDVFVDKVDALHHEIDFGLVVAPEVRKPPKPAKPRKGRQPDAAAARAAKKPPRKHEPRKKRRR